jgi:hypothetical protein
MDDTERRSVQMFTLNGGARTADRSVADVQTHELHAEQPSGPLGGELLDLYAAVLIIVPLALVMKAFLF